MKNDWIRDQIEAIIKRKEIDRQCFGEVDKLRYQSIYEEVEEHFVDKRKDKNATLHWANINGYHPRQQVVLYCDMSEQFIWFHRLPDIFIDKPDKVYFLAEEGGRQRTKFWIYEATMESLMQLLDEGIPLYDYYIVSKKYDWLISLNHHLIASFIGKGFRDSEIKKYEVIK